MRNWIRTAVISAVVAWSGGAAWGFDYTPTGTTFVPLGECEIVLQLSSDFQQAAVAVQLTRDGRGHNNSGDAEFLGPW